ncbi:unnamed protein product [marine sediment metagenome]|uniref:Uncharacterized protein n=1 Tax=marine sediment metagenome TaxID=412755 RepID=X0XYM3_9ZZZZ
MPKDDLTKRQEAAVKRFVAAVKEYNRGLESLRKKRLRALASALNAGVYATTLARFSGLATSRLYQMKDELKESK